MITDLGREGAESFEKNNWAKLCKEAIAWGLADDEDIPAYFKHGVCAFEFGKLSAMKLTFVLIDFAFTAERPHSCQSIQRT